MDAEELILKAVQDVVNELAPKMASELAHKLATRGKSEYYFRTGDLVNALNHPKVTINKGNLHIDWFDINYIHQRVTSAQRRFNEHMSLNGDKSYSGEYNGEFLNESYQVWSLLLQNSGYKVPTGRKIPGLHYIEGVLGNDPEAYVNDLIKKTMIKYILQVRKAINAKGVK